MRAAVHIRGGEGKCRWRVALVLMRVCVVFYTPPVGVLRHQFSFVWCPQEPTEGCEQNTADIRASDMKGLLPLGIPKALAPGR